MIYPILLYAYPDFSGKVEAGLNSVLQKETPLGYYSKIELQIDGNIDNYGSFEAIAILKNSKGLNELNVIKKKSIIGELFYLESGFSTGNDQLDELITILTKMYEDGKLNNLLNSKTYPDDQIVLDRLLINLNTKYVDFRIGRQQIAWGTGYAFNPTDIWNMKNPLDPMAPKLGVMAIKTEVPLGDISGADIVFSPGNDLRSSSYGLRVKSGFNSIDYSFSTVKNSLRKELGAEDRVMFGIDVAGQIWDEGPGFWSESATNYIYKNNNFDVDSLEYKIDFGIDYTLDNGLYLMSEYLFNSLGAGSKNEYSYYSLLKTASGELSGFAEQYLFNGCSYSLNSDVKLSLYSLVNLNDSSFALLPEINYIYSENIEFKLNYIKNYGNYNTEYGSYEDSISLIATAYF